MNSENYIGKRLLVILTRSSWSDRIQEVRVEEISPSTTHTKLMDSNGTKFWVKTADIRIIETLADLIKRPE